ncbi:glucose 1-dehydrogenase 3 [Coccidioides immitis RMSCC 2394]|uniref:Glucose 1-dehydrogenase 3 n=1 Tax=Coccidioides immitis RMSCC 2394 TaxID=404692 RepID=A0A0J6YE49_COCIT|nr:glucose 1-dehydrogenase 3 [Coccidioides immitis RMSCC 2394]
MAASVGRLHGKTAVVTGASSGIGRAIALRYAAEGAHVVCADIDSASKDPDDTRPTHEAINQEYPAGEGTSQRSIFVKTDVTSGTEVENLVRECVKAFGRLDIMVNNAGVANGPSNPPGPIHKTPESSWDTIVGVNAKGVWLGCKHAITQMLNQDPHPSGDRGWVINMASVLGLVGSTGTSPYCASKGAVVQMTKSIALDYGQDRIHVNGIAPGYIETPLVKPFLDPHSPDPRARALYAAIGSKHPFAQRMGKPEEIAGSAVFLASDDASWITGHILPVEGGYLAQ